MGQSWERQGAQWMVPGHQSHDMLGHLHNTHLLRYAYVTRFFSHMFWPFHVTLVGICLQSFYPMASFICQSSSLSLHLLSSHNRGERGGLGGLGEFFNALFYLLGGRNKRIWVKRRKTKTLISTVTASFSIKPGTLEGGRKLLMIVS